MNENNVVDTEYIEENGVSDTEFELSDTEYSKNVVVDGVDSVNSDSNISTVYETSANYVDIETYYNAELGGYPVVIVQDLTGDYGTSLMADYEDYYTTLSTTWEDYFAGVLANIGDTDYLAYSLRDYANSNYSSYTDHYVLYYDLEIENDTLVGGSYPYMDVYRDGSYGYICREGVGTLASVPFPGYGSFGNLSDLREGVTHNETWTILFAIGFAVVYSVCAHIFDCVQSLRRCSKG